MSTITWKPNLEGPNSTWVLYGGGTKVGRVSDEVYGDPGVSNPYLKSDTYTKQDFKFSGAAIPAGAVIQSVVLRVSGYLNAASGRNVYAYNNNTYSTQAYQTADWVIISSYTFNAAPGGASWTPTLLSSCAFGLDAAGDASQYLVELWLDINYVIYSASGTISTPGGSPLSGVTVTASGSLTGSTTTDANGNYTINIAASGTTVVTPALTGYAFNPTSRSYTNPTANQTSQNFTGFQVVTISGTVKDAAGIGKTNYAMRGTFGTLVIDATTDINGAYSIAGDKTQNAVIKSIQSGYTADPPTRSYGGPLTQNIAGQDFVTYQSAPSSNEAALGYNDTQSTVTTDAKGYYKFTAVCDYNYEITPTLAGMSFLPTKLNYNRVLSDITNAHFKAIYGIDTINFNDLYLYINALCFDSQYNIRNLHDAIQKLAIDFCCFTGILNGKKAFFKSLFYPYPAVFYDNKPLIEHNVGILPVVEFVRVRCIIENTKVAHDVGTETQAPGKFISRDPTIYGFSAWYKNSLGVFQKGTNILGIKDGVQYSVYAGYDGDNWKASGDLIKDFWYKHRGDPKKCEIHHFKFGGFDYSIIQNFTFEGIMYQPIKVTKIPLECATSIDALRIA